MAEKDLLPIKIDGQCHISDKPENAHYLSIWKVSILKRLSSSLVNFLNLYSAALRLMSSGARGTVTEVALAAARMHPASASLRPSRPTTAAISTRQRRRVAVTLATVPSSDAATQGTN